MNWFNRLLGFFSFITLCLGLVLYVLYPLAKVLWLSTWSVSAFLWLIWLVIHCRRVWQFLSYKSTRYGANLSLIIFLVLGSLIFINYFAKEHDKRWDVTFRRTNSLSPQTKKILKDLDRKVRFSYFGDGQRFRQKKLQAEKSLKAYRNETKLVELEFVEVNQRPTYAKSLDVAEYDTVVMGFVGDDKKVTKVKGVAEEKLTNGLIRLLKNEEQVVYFTVGHGERGLGDTKSAESLSLLASFIEQESYTVRTLNLAKVGKVPEDATTLVIAGPKTGFLPQEIKELEEWLSKGGRLLVAFDLDLSRKGLPSGAKQMAKLLKSYGVEVGEKLILDTSSRQAQLQGQMIIGSTYSHDHMITKDFPRSNIKLQQVANFVFPFSTYLLPGKVEETNRGEKKFKIIPLARSPITAWAEHNWSELKTGRVHYNEGTDDRGEKSLALAIEEAAKESPTRLVVFSTSTFVVNGLIELASNKDFFMNALAWLSDQGSFISIRSKGEVNSRLNLDPSWMNLIFLIIVLAFPVLIFGTGIWVWKMRSSR